MTKIRVIRLEQTNEGALGSLMLNNRLFCTTLEPDDADPERNQIPAGHYRCRRFHGNKYKDTFEIIVPDHTDVLFHPGNIEDHSTMCVLLGQYPGKLMGHRAVLNSGTTFKKFMAILGNIQEFEAEFINFYPKEQGV